MPCSVAKSRTARSRSLLWSQAPPQPAQMAAVMPATERESSSAPQRGQFRATRLTNGMYFLRAAAPRSAASSQHAGAAGGHELVPGWSQPLPLALLCQESFREVDPLFQHVNPLL